jgi:protein TonB
MLQLIESGAPARHPTRWTMASVAVHAALITAAVALTARGVVTPPPRSTPPDVFYVRPPVPAAPHASPMAAAQSVPNSITAPYVDVPEVPRVDFGREPIVRAVSPSDFIETALHVAPAGAASGTTVGVGAVHTPAMVERAVVPHAHNPVPTYPSTLRSANVAGEVLVRFIVDTVGRVEPGSVEITRTTHVLFAEAVRRWLRTTSYLPAQVGGRPVRQLVEQHVGFALQP